MLNDTTPEIARFQIEGLRRMSPARKLALLGDMTRMARALALAGLRARYPQAPESELRRRLADLLLGSELAARVYGPAPEDPHAG